MSEGTATVIDFERPPVNLWPLFYREGNMMSFLWPLIDIDPRGYAIRPFFNREDADYSILFPLSSWNTRTGDWHALNLLRRRDFFGMIPLGGIWNHGASGWVLNIWWKEKGFGVFPLYYYTPASQGVLFPLSCWSDGSGWALNTAWNKNHVGILSLLWFSPHSTINSFLFPLSGWNDDYGWALNTFWGEDHFGILPLLWISPQFNLAGPVYWGNHSFGFFPLFFYGSDGKDYKFLSPLFSFSPRFSSVLFPLSGWGDGYGWALNTFWGQNHFGFFPLFFYGSDEKDNNFLSPLFSFSTCEQQLSWLNILLPLYTFQNHGSHSKHHILFPFGYFSTAAERPFHIFPLYSHNTGVPSLVYQNRDTQRNGVNFEFNMLFRLLFHCRTWRTTGNFQFDDDIRIDEYSALGLLHWGSKDTVKPTSETASKLHSQLYYYSPPRDAQPPPRTAQAPEEETLHQLQRQSWTDDIKNLQQNLNLPVEVPENRQDAERVQQLLVENYSKVETSSYCNFFPLWFYNQSSRKGTMNILWPLFHLESDIDGCSWDFLWFVARQNAGNTHSSFEILRFLYQYKETPAARQYTVFPFITWAEDKFTGRRKFSFLWRVFRLETAGDKTSGHLFFIPFGKSPE